MQNCLMGRDQDLFFGIYCLSEFQEEEQKLRKVALNISKDVKKFWVKIEKLVSLLL